MYQDLEGFYRPIIDDSTCSKCQRCRSACPIISPVCLERNVMPKAYACWNMDEEIRFNSTSGGIFSVFADSILDKDGVVFGACFDEDLVVRHRYISNKEDLKILRGSKYVQSDINNSYTQAKNFLENKKWVLFTGTPCQIAGLYAFLGKKYEKLLTLDLICHGVPSPGVFGYYIRYIENDNLKLKNIKFRDKKKGWKRPVVIYEYENATKNNPYVLDPYIFGFGENIYLRPSCYACHYSCIPRQGDITIGDFWGLGDREIFSHVERSGISLALINSDMGRELIEKCEGKIFRIERKLEEAIQGNPNLVHPSDLSPKRKDFFQHYQQSPELAFDKILKRSPKEKLALLLPPKLLSILQKILSR